MFIYFTYTRVKLGFQKLNKKKDRNKYIFFLMKKKKKNRASMVAQTVKNLPAMQETLAQFLGWEDPLEEGMAIHFSILA